MSLIVFLWIETDGNVALTEWQEVRKAKSWMKKDERKETEQQGVKGDMKEWPMGKNEDHSRGF